MNNVLANSKMIYDKIMENYEEGLQGVVNVNKGLEKHIETIESKLKSLREEFNRRENEMTLN